MWLDVVAFQVSEDDDDGRLGFAEDAFFDDAKTIVGFEHGTFGVEGYVIEEEFQQVRVELPSGDVAHDVVSDVRRIGLFVWALTGERVIDVGDGDDFGVAMDFVTRETARVARTVDVLVMFRGDGGQNGRLGQLVFHNVDAFGAAQRVGLDDVELVVGQPRRLGEDFFRDGDFAEVMQQRTEREDLQVLLCVVAEHAEHGGENRYVDAMAERIGIV